MTTLITSMVLLPLTGAVVNALFGRYHGKHLSGTIACAALGGSFALAVTAFLRLLQLPPGQRIVDATLFTWIEVGVLQVDCAFRLDPLSGVMALVVTGVGFLIHIYSLGYMQKDPGFVRYFIYLNLFVFLMMVLVMGANLPLMFVGWEGVGLCSYLLIGFWFEDESKARAGRKAFLVNRIGDLFFILGVALLYWALGSAAGVYSLDFAQIEAHLDQLVGVTLGGVGILTLCSLFLFIGATGKSAQIPLYVWLPDAMAGPTPVSALIHAATMVTAGVYMVVRLHPMYLRAPEVMWVIAWVGGLTAFFAATIALVQTDIKKVLAYSTVSQLGYMFAATGVGAFGTAIFHLVTHAFFKALLFLGAGSVIHGMHEEQDIRRMGGLRSKMPTTFWTFAVATLAIAGLPPLAGFFSKDEILFMAYGSRRGSTALFALLLVAAVLTAFYMVRLFCLTFLGPCRASKKVQDRIHESPPSMTLPLSTLAVLSAVSGFLGMPHWLGHNRLAELLQSQAPQPGFVPPGRLEGLSLDFIAGAQHLELALAAGSVVAALLGVGWAWVRYATRGSLPPEDDACLSVTHRVLMHKYHVDEIYGRIVVAPLSLLASALARFIDPMAIDRPIASWLPRSIDTTGAFASKMQSGNIQHYLMAVLLGAAGLLMYLTLFTLR